MVRPVQRCLKATSDITAARSPSTIVTLRHIALQHVVLGDARQRFEHGITPMPVTRERKNLHRAMIRIDILVDQRGHAIEIATRVGRIEIGHNLARRVGSLAVSHYHSRIKGRFPVTITIDCMRCENSSVSPRWGFTVTAKNLQQVRHARIARERASHAVGCYKLLRKAA